MEAATHFERAAALCNAPAGKADLVRIADCCRSRAEQVAELDELRAQKVAAKAQLEEAKVTRASLREETKAYFNALPTDNAYRQAYFNAVVEL